MMRTTNYIHLFIIFALLVLVLDGCKPKDVDVPEEKTSEVGNVVISEMKEIATKTIATDGGELEVKDPQSALNGFKVTVPKGAYQGANSFSVSTANVVRQTFGEEYKVLSPLISIAAPSGYIDDFVTIEVPISLPANHFATAVFINEAGKPDLLPMISLSSNKIVVATNSFSPVNQAKNGRISSVNSLKLFILGMDKAMLADLNYATGFKPGEDDWAFANYGSIVAPNGYCSASSFSSLWYFKYKKQANNKPLYQLGQSPNAPASLRSDAIEGQLNSVGIKYVSVLHELNSQLNNSAKTYVKELKKLNDSTEYSRDKLTFLFASAYLKVTKEPLLLGLDHNLKILGTALGGHMIRIIGKQGGGLIISDPNYPGKTLILGYTSSKGFENYICQSIYEVVFQIESFYALPPWIFNKELHTEIIWTDFENESIINTAFFSSFGYTIKNLNEKVTEIVLNPGKATKIQSPFQIEISSTSSQPPTNALLVSDSGKVVKPLPSGFYELKPGPHKIGILVKQDITYNGQVHKNLWADFRWFDVEVAGDEQSASTNTSFLLDGKRYNLVLDYHTGYRSPFGGTYNGGWTPFRNEPISMFVGVDSKGPGTYNCIEQGYNIKVPSPGSGDITIKNSAGQQTTYFSKSGSVTVTRNDEWFEGTFNFVAEHLNSGKTITISDGKFKIKVGN